MGGEAMRKWLGLLAAILLLSALLKGAQAQQLSDLIPAGSRPELLRSEFSVAQGIAADGAGNVYFADQGTSKVWRIDTDKRFFELMTAPEGAYSLSVSEWLNLVVSEPIGARISAFTRHGKMMITIMGSFSGVVFPNPREVCADDIGGVYFTGPYSVSESMTPAERSRERGVFYAPFMPGNNLISLLSDLVQPSGVAISLDGKKLYVADAGGGVIKVGQIVRFGHLANVAEFARLKIPEERQRKDKDIPTGLAVDASSNLYAASPDGIQVFSSTGKPLGIIAVPEVPTHLCFGGRDGKTMYISAGKSIYILPVKVGKPVSW
jgi:gluconolactonase